jgi:hypothetical protein
MIKIEDYIIFDDILYLALSEQFARSDGPIGPIPP